MIEFLCESSYSFFRVCICFARKLKQEEQYSRLHLYDHAKYGSLLIVKKGYILARYYVAVYNVKYDNRITLCKIVVVY